jgi:hypothetical protein
VEIASQATQRQVVCRIIATVFARCDVIDRKALDVVGFAKVTVFAPTSSTTPDKLTQRFVHC